MSISNILETQFVACNKCRYREKRRVLKKNGRGKETKYYCTRKTPWRELFGQRGCAEGMRILTVDEEREVRNRWLACTKENGGVQ